MEIEIRGGHFILSPCRVMFWKEEKILIISDAHFSKETHFRKNGIAVPAGILQTDLKIIDQLISDFQPDRILFLGDMFHSEENEGLNEFIAWRKKNADQKLILVSGNHDILHADWYTFAGIEVIEKKLTIGSFNFTHEKIMNDGFNFSGHIHPCIIMHGNARQSLRLPCFWISDTFAVMPAFGRFTGSKSIMPSKDDTIFAIGNNEIFRL